MKRLISFLIAITLFLAFTGCSETGTEETQVGGFEWRQYPDDKRMIIFGDFPPNTSRDSLIDYKNSGMNTYLLWVGTASYNPLNPLDNPFTNGLVLANELGLEVMIRYTEDYSNIDVYSALDFNNYYVNGFYFVDEPSAAEFDDIRDYYLAWYNQKYANTDKYFYLNLYPSYASNGQLGTTSGGGKSAYQNYIAQFVEKIVNNVQGKKDIGLDHYPLKIRAGELYVSDTWLYDLIVVGTAAKESGADFHTCIQAFSDGSEMRPITNSLHFEFQYYVSMAFGAKNFEIFPYSSAKSLKYDALYYGEPTEYYNYFKAATNKITKFDHVFLNFDWEGVKTFVGTENTNEFIGYFDIISRWTLPSLEGVTVSSTQDTLVGQFADGEDKGFIVVNYNDPGKSTTSVVTLNFDKAEKAIVYRNGVEFRDILKDKTLTLPMLPGEGVFVIPVN